MTMNSRVIQEKGYSFSLVNIECMPSSAHFNVVMNLEHSIQELLPYLAAVYDGCTYIHGADVVNFMESGHIVSFYPNQITITDVAGIQEAAQECRHYFQKLQEVSDQRELIEPVYNKRSTLTVLDIFRRLPQTNCGDCSSPTCLAFASRVFRREASIRECAPLAEEMEKHKKLIQQLQANGYDIS
jgi:ArsR family metal-binding transcriptional regulator